jgi:integrase
MAPKANRSKTGYDRLQRRGGTYYFRAKIPRELLEAYRRPPEKAGDTGKYQREIVIALGTTDLEEAKLAAQGQSLLTNWEFKLKRDELHSAELAAVGVKRQSVITTRQAIAEAQRRRPMKDVRIVTAPFADVIRLSLVRRLLDEDKRERIDPERRAGVDLRAESRAESLAVWEECIRTGDTEAFHEAAIMEAELHTYRVAPDAKDIGLLAYAYVEGCKQAALSLARRDQGEFVDSELIAPLARTALRERRAAGTSFQDLLDLWIEGDRQPAEAPRPQKTVDIYRLDLKEFETFVHARARDFVEEVTNEDWLDFADHLKKTRHYKTVMRKLGAIRTIFNWASQKRKLPAGNPCSRIKVAIPRNTKKPRLPFSPDELQLIFDSPVFCEGWRPKRARCGESIRWLPILGAFTGAREEELGQLRVSDIAKVEGLGWFIRITDEHPGQVLKTQSSRRRVPVHPELIRCGLLDYADRQRALGHDWLFDQLTPDRMKKRTGSFSKLFMRYLRKQLKITDSTRTFHSFRHGFKDACRENSVPLPVHDSFTGHVGEGSGKKYGGVEYPLAALFQEMKKVRYPGLDLSRLYSKGARRRSTKTRPRHLASSAR